jgi:flagellar protein FliS
MAITNPYEQYKTTQISTATPGQLVVMLYDGAIKFCKMAKLGIEQKNIETANNNLIKVQNIIQELKISLDMKAGGELSETLDALYEYMLRRLIEANMKKDIKIINEVQKNLEELREAWVEAVKQTGGIKRP